MMKLVSLIGKPVCVILYIAGIVLAWIGANMITVSAACCAVVFILELFV